MSTPTTPSRAALADNALLGLATLSVGWLAIEVRGSDEPDTDFALGIVAGAAFTMGSLWAIYEGMGWVFRRTGVALPAYHGRVSPWWVGVAFAAVALLGAGLLAATSPAQGAVAGGALAIGQQTEHSRKLGGRALGVMMGLGTGAALLFVAVVVGTSPAVEGVGVPGMLALLAPGARATAQGISYVFERAPDTAGSGGPGRTP